MEIGRRISIRVCLYECDEYDALITGFDCGNSALNEYLVKNYELSERGVYLFIDESSRKIAAYGSLVCTSLIRENHGKQYQTPAIEIKTFAVDKAYQNLPFSEDREDGVFADKVFNDFMDIAFELSETVIGAKCLTLYSVPSVQNFYERNGFSTFEESMSKFYNNFNEFCIPMYYEL